MIGRRQSRHEPEPSKQFPGRRELISGRIGIASRGVVKGIGDCPAEVARTASRVIDAGAIGMNLEDSTGRAEKPLADLPLQLEKIHAVRQEADRKRVPIVINARTDPYLERVGSLEKRFEETVRRGKAYQEAGADCVFVPGVHDPAILFAIARELGCPVNVLAVANSPSIGQLATLGVARVSLGSGPMRATLTLLLRLAAELGPERIRCSKASWRTRRSRSSCVEPPRSRRWLRCH
jgi:2-methylisocitrate lyase-like PEP mutase family enzyme